MAKDSKYLATRPLEHDGKPVSEGGAIALGDAAAAPLLACGAIERAPSKAQDKPKDA